MARKTPVKEPAAKEPAARQPAAKEPAVPEHSRPAYLEATGDVSSAEADAPLALAALGREIGAPRAGLLDSLLADVEDESLVAMGRKIQTAKVVGDCVRIYGRAYQIFRALSPAQRKLLRGFSLELLKLGVAQAQTLERLGERHQQRASEDTALRATVDTLLSRETAVGVTVRDQARDAMRYAAGSNKPRRIALDEAVGTAETPELLAQGLEALGSLLSRWLDAASKDAALADRLALYSLDAGYAAELGRRSVQIKAARVRAQNRPGALSVSQTQLDRGDGINLLILGQVVRAFEHGHDLDPAIPILVPTSTRRVLGLARRVAPGGIDPAAPPKPGEPVEPDDDE